MPQLYNTNGPKNYNVLKRNIPRFLPLKEHINLYTRTYIFKNTNEFLVYNMATDELMSLPLEELAARFKQQGNTCALASMLFSVALLYRKSSCISKSIKEDIELILNGKDGYRILEDKILPPTR